MMNARRITLDALMCTALVFVSPASAARATQVSQDRVAPWELKAGQRCMDCHLEVANASRVHSPVREGKCDLCHLMSDPLRHSFSTTADMAATCLECHPLPVRTIVHAPVKEGECLECHKPHQSHARYLLRERTEKDLCAKCHSEQAGLGKAFVHGPAALGLCSMCHSPHSSTKAHLLRDDTNQTCLACHEEMTERLVAPHNVHEPVAKDCALCHDPHSSDHKYQLKKERRKLCLDCHKPIMDKLGAEGIVHQALSGSDGCVHCHDPHSSTLPKMLKKPVDKLCLSCHENAIQREDGTFFPGIGDRLSVVEHPHGPIRDGNCSACHNPHGSVTFSLLLQPYPKAFYAPYEEKAYKLCFGCHDVKAFSTEGTVAVTGFRDGDRNLHSLHVNKNVKGRTCRACHDTHGSNLPFHMTESVPFGSWDIPINFRETQVGGSCAPGCHVPQEYNNGGAKPQPASLKPRSSKKAAEANTNPE